MRPLQEPTSVAARPDGMSGEALPPFLATLVAEEQDDRPVPALGLGDQDAAVALLAATRAVLLARTEVDVVSAVARFSLDMGGRLQPASQDRGTAIPVDIALGTGPPVLVDADALSISRMRLEQLLPTLVEDARSAISRLCHLDDVTAASETDPLTGLLSRRALMRRLPVVRVSEVLCRLDIDDIAGDLPGRSSELALADLGVLIRNNLSRDEEAGRYGASEIVVILRGVSELVAVQRLHQLNDLWRAGEHGSVTFSAGAAAVDAGGWPEALKKAETVIYTARTRGHADSQEQPVGQS